MARRSAGDVPFFLISGVVGEETAVEALKAGANDYLFKGNLRRTRSAVEPASCAKSRPAAIPAGSNSDCKSANRSLPTPIAWPA